MTRSRGTNDIWVTGTVLVIVMMWRNKVSSSSMEHHLKMMGAEGYEKAKNLSKTGIVSFRLI